MGIRIRKIIVFGSLSAVMLLLLASCSSVVAFQTVQSQSKTVPHLIADRIEQALDRFSFKDRLLQRFDQTTPDTRLMHDEKLESLLARCSSVKEMLGYEVIPERILFVLVTTILVEFFVYLMTIQAPVLLLFFLSLTINLMTNPAVNFVFYYIYDNVLVLESLVVMVETIMIFTLFNVVGMGVSLGQAGLLSFVANLMSYLIASGLARIFYGIPAET